VLGVVAPDQDEVPPPVDLGDIDHGEVRLPPSRNPGAEVLDAKPVD
jgi:hypothetical protein